MDTSQPPRSSQPVKNQPLELLQRQVELLAEISRGQQEQQETFATLNHQLEALALQLNPLTSKSEGQMSGLLHTKIENINVPFWSLVGFLLKLSFATIPAVIVMTLLYFLVFGVLGVTFGAFF